MLIDLTLPIQVIFYEVPKVSCFLKVFLVSAHKHMSSHIPDSGSVGFSVDNSSDFVKGIVGE